MSHITIYESPLFEIAIYLISCTFIWRIRARVVGTHIYLVNNDVLLLFLYGLERYVVHLVYVQVVVAIETYKTSFVFPQVTSGLLVDIGNQFVIHLLRFINILYRYATNYRYSTSSREEPPMQQPYAV